MLRDGRSDLRLAGVFYSDNGEESIAIVEVNNGKEKRVRKTQWFEEGIRLLAVEKKRVIIEKFGEVTALRISNSNLSVNYNAKNRNAHSRILSGGEISSNRELVLKTSGLEPVSKTNAEGYRVGKGSEEIQEKYGLKEGDVIVSANGYPLGTEIKDLLAYKSFKDAGTVNIVIVRESEEITLSYAKDGSKL